MTRSEKCRFSPNRGEKKSSHLHTSKNLEGCGELRRLVYALHELEMPGLTKCFVLLQISESVKTMRVLATWPRNWTCLLEYRLQRRLSLFWLFTFCRPYFRNPKPYAINLQRSSHLQATRASFSWLYLAKTSLLSYYCGVHGFWQATVQLSIVVNISHSTSALVDETGQSARLIPLRKALQNSVSYTKQDFFICLYLGNRKKRRNSFN